MFTLLRMPNANRFLEVVEKSAGHAFLHLPDDTLIDVKKDHTTQQMFRTMDLGRNGLRFSLFDSSTSQSSCGIWRKAAVNVWS